MLSAVGDDRNWFLIVASDYAIERRAAFRLKCDRVADPKVEHLRVRPHLVHEARPRDDPVVSSSSVSWSMSIFMTTSAFQ